jgi:hypothetical protein
LKDAISGLKRNLIGSLCFVGLPCRNLFNHDWQVHQPGTDKFDPADYRSDFDTAFYPSRQLAGNLALEKPIPWKPQQALGCSDVN